MSPRNLGISLAIVTGLCWAVLAIFLKYALQFSSTGSIIWIRMFFASLTLAIFLLIKKPHSFKKVFTQWSGLSIVAGLFLSANYFGYMYGIELTTASNAQIMIQLGPLTFLFASVFIFKEKLRGLQWFGITVALFGFLLFNWDQVLVTLSKKDIYLLGNSWIIFAAITWTIYALIQKKVILSGWSPQEINLIIYIVAAISLFPFANLSEFSDRTVWQWIIFYALGLNTVIAYGAFAEALALIPSSLVSLIISVNPLLTIFFMEVISSLGMTFVSPEPIYWRGYLGAILVVIGVGISVSFKPRPKSSLVTTGLRN